MGKDYQELSDAYDKDKQTWKNEKSEVNKSLVSKDSAILEWEKDYQELSDAYDKEKQTWKDEKAEFLERITKLEKENTTL